VTCCSCGHLGPRTAVSRPISTPAYDAGLYIARNGGPVESYKDLVLIKNDPDYNEQWPRALGAVQRDSRSARAASVSISPQ
jgi:hypothetical protein